MTFMTDKVSQALTYTLAATLTLFMLGFFYIPNAVDQYKFFGIAVFLPALPLLPAMRRTVASNAIVQTMAAYLCWMLVSSFWSHDFDGNEFFKTAKISAYIALFVLLGAYLGANRKFDRDAGMALLCVGAALAAIISIALWYTDHPFPQSRIIGIGTLENPNPSAFVYGFFAVSAAHLAMRSAQLRLRLAFALCTLALLGFVILTKSNTGILATLVSIAALAGFHRHQHRLYLIGGVALLGATAAYLAFSFGMLDNRIDSGFTARVPIWRTVCEQVEQAPLIGHGYQKQTLVTANGAPSPANYAHNALLASARDGGIVGASLHVLLLVLALAAALKTALRDGDPYLSVCLLFGLICMSADTDQLITRPRELWVILWWPLAMVIAARLRKPGA